MNWLKLSALACSLVWAAPLAHAAEYPVRPIKLIVPYAAGGPTDVLGRMVGEYLSRDLKQTVVVENKAGAQGAIGAEAAARSEPDGYTLFFTAASIFVLNPMLYKKLPYDPTRDFRLLALVTDLPVVMEVHPSVPAKTAADLVAYAKQAIDIFAFSQRYVVSIEGNDGQTLYRARFGMFGEDEARNICGRMMEVGQTCFAALQGE